MAIIKDIHFDCLNSVISNSFLTIAYHPEFSPYTTDKRPNISVARGRDIASMATNCLARTSITPSIASGVTAGLDSFLEIGTVEEIHRNK